MKTFSEIKSFTQFRLSMNKLHHLIYIPVFMLFEVQPLLAQIPFAKTQNSEVQIDTSSSPNYFKKYKIPDFSTPRRIVHPFLENFGCRRWCLYDLLTHYLKGERILYIGKQSETHSFVWIDKGNGRIDYEEVILPPLTYFTVGNYYVCKEQIDSLRSAFVQKGFKCKEIVEKPAEFSGISLLQKKKYDDYKAQLAEYESLPRWFPPGLRIELKGGLDYVDLKTWNNTPHDASYGYLIELIDDNNKVYYVWNHLRNQFISISLWENYLSKLKGQSFHLWVSSAKNKYVFQNGESIEKCNELIDLYSSFTLNYTCTDIALKEEDPRDVVAEFTNDKGEVMRGLLWWDENKESNVLEFARYDSNMKLTSSGTFLTKNQINNHLKALEIQKEELIKKEAEHNESIRCLYAKIQELHSKNLAEMKAKYGDFYGSHVANHNIVEGMTKEMVIDAMLFPPDNIEIFRTGGHVIERLTYFNDNNNRIVELTDGKVTTVYSLNTF